MAQFSNLSWDWCCLLLPQWLKYPKAWTDFKTWMRCDVMHNVAIVTCCLIINQMLFQYWHNYNWLWLPVKKRVDVKPHELHACICYFSDNFTRHVWRRFKPVRQRMTSCTCLKGLVCIILLLFLLQKSGSLKEFRKINNIKKNVQWHLRACTWNSAFAVTIFF